MKEALTHAATWMNLKEASCKNHVYDPIHIKCPE
jgi:hypothetical protein